MTEIGCGPLWRIDGPSPQAPLYGLLGSARVVDDVDESQVERWGNGVEVYPYPPGVAEVLDANASGTNRVKSAGGAIPQPMFGAMVVVFAETCSSFGIFGADLTNDQAQQRFVKRALASFAAIESAAVEREFIAGDALGNDPHLADGNGDFPWGDTPTSPTNGLALLETAIADSGRRGMIHISPGLAIAGANARLLERDDRAGTLRTINGTPVVPGYGYAGAAAPAGPHAAATLTQEWAYATGPVELRRSMPQVLPENLFEALDRETNTVTYRVERYYVVNWDTVVQAAVLIDRCETECGSAPS